MGQRACKIIFAIFALFLLFLSCNPVEFKDSDSVEYFEKAAQSEPVLKNSERILVWILPEETLFKIELDEVKPILMEEPYFSVRLVSLIYPVGILAPPSF